MLKVLDLFSGIGGFSLGLERTGGFETVAFCEIEPYQRAVLARHWPKVKQYHDVRDLSAQHLTADGIAVDVICGGFPCQDISIAGQAAGLAGERSGLWSEFARLIGEIRPRYVIVENVSALLGRGLGDILGDLAALGYDAEWHCIPASAVGAPHRRDRIWIVAYAQESGRGIGTGLRNGGERGWRHKPSDSSAPVADACRSRLPLPQREALFGAGRWEEGRAASERGWWAIEPDVGRVAHGVPKRVDALRALGNAVVPHIPEIIGRAILAAEAA